MDPSVYPEDRKPCSLSRYVGTEAHLVPSETQVKAQRERERERERERAPVRTFKFHFVS